MALESLTAQELTRYHFKEHENEKGTWDGIVC
jgi:hypothetical protein